MSPPESDSKEHNTQDEATTGGTRPGHDTGPRRRRRTAQRQAEIATATLSLIAQHGLQGATVHRIAGEVGIIPPSLYAHFPGRQEILVAAMDLLFEKVRNGLSLSKEPSILERLREITRDHIPVMTQQLDGSIVPMFEFVTASRDSGLAQLGGRRQLEVIDLLADLVEQGKRQGSIRNDIDSRLAAWELMVLMWADEMALLSGCDELVTKGHLTRITEMILDDMACMPTQELDRPDTAKPKRPPRKGTP